jgi:hypothetical protein
MSVHVCQCSSDRRRKEARDRESANAGITTMTRLGILQAVLAAVGIVGRGHSPSTFRQVRTANIRPSDVDFLV